jgi:hypothetical protein
MGVKGPLGTTPQEARVKIATLCTPRGSLSAHLLPANTEPPKATKASSPASNMVEIPDRWHVLERPEAALRDCYSPRSFISLAKF